MSMSKQVTIMCDGTQAEWGQCAAAEQVSDSAAGARRYLRGEGWTSKTGSKDYCPACSVRLDLAR